MLKKALYMAVMIPVAIFLLRCEKEISVEQLVVRDSLFYEVNSEVPFSGKAIKYFKDNTALSETFVCKNGILNGSIKAWFPNGQNKYEGTLVGGQPEGQLTEWFLSGQKRKESFFHNGKLDGIVKKWSENGQKVLEEKYSEGERNGTTNKWDINGVKRMIGQNLHGHKTGSWEYYDMSGEKTKEQIFDNGLLISTVLPKSVTDIDGNEYEIVTIGNQVWMAENLRVRHFRNGDKIPYIPNQSDWAETYSGAFCFYNNDSSQSMIHGALYNWHAVYNDDRAIAPEGWHVASDDDYKELEMYLGMNQAEADSVGWRGKILGSQLAGKEYLWETGLMKFVQSFDLSGFSATPSGIRSEDGAYSERGFLGAFWTQSIMLFNTACFRGIAYDIFNCQRGYVSQNIGLSVRCVKD